MVDAIFNDVLSEEHERGTRRCGLGKTFDAMPDDLVRQVKEAMNDPKWNASAISRTLIKFGFKVSENSVRRCRRICNCWRPL